MQLTTTICQGTPFSGRVDSSDIGPVRICKIAAAPHGSDRLNQMQKADTLPYYKIVFQLSGTLRLEQNDRRTVIGPGHWCVYDVSRPYGIANMTEVDQRAILFAKDAVPESLDRVLRLLLDHAFPMNGVSSVLGDCLVSTLEQLESVPDRPAEALGESIFELARLALMEKTVAHAATPVSETLRERVKKYIRRNLADPNLSISDIAQSMGCSKRYIHKIFSEEGRTPGDFIRECRLAHCGDDLTDPALTDRTITEIALNWGFNNLSHFSQAFKEQFGMSPRTFRAHRLHDLREVEIQ